MTYDQWKTTDPRDYEPEQDDGPDELELAYEMIHEAEAKAKNDARVAAKRIKELTDALEFALEYFRDRYDTVDGDNGPLPNKEMRMGQLIDETLHGIRF